MISYLFTAVKRVKHTLAHWLNLNDGEVEARWEGDKLMVGFRCHGCGRLQGVHQASLGDRHE